MVVIEFTSGYLPVTEAARAEKLSRQHIYRLLKRYREDWSRRSRIRVSRPVINLRGGAVT